MLIDETEMLKMVRKAKKVLLVEPEYPRKYPPMGLLKIASMVKANGGSVAGFYRGAPGGLFAPDADLICITSIFTYDVADVKRAICGARDAYPKTRIILGGVCASLISKELDKEFPDVHIFKGYSKALDQCIPDYTIDCMVEDPWDQFSYTFTSRGCVNRCGYCAVWRIEPELWINPKWKDMILLSKPFAMISDNNISASPDHLKEVAAHLTKTKRQVVFDNGLDCKLITDDMAKSLSTIRYTREGLRMAFDRIEDDGIFQRAVKRLTKAGVAPGNIMAYVLFNFNDTLDEANYRMRECARLGIRPYPQKFTPLNETNYDRNFLGKHWDADTASAFRYFWLMAGYYTKSTFNEFRDNIQKDPLTRGLRYAKARRTTKNE